MWDKIPGIMGTLAYAMSAIPKTEKSREELLSDVEKLEQQHKMLRRGMTNLGMQLSHQCDATAAEQETIRQMKLAHSAETERLHTTYGKIKTDLQGEVATLKSRVAELEKLVPLEKLV